MLGPDFQHGTVARAQLARRHRAVDAVDPERPAVRVGSAFVAAVDLVLGDQHTTLVGHAQCSQDQIVLGLDAPGTVADLLGVAAVPALQADVAQAEELAVEVVDVVGIQVDAAGGRHQPFVVIACDQRVAQVAAVGDARGAQFQRVAHHGAGVGDVGSRHLHRIAVHATGIAEIAGRTQRDATTAIACRGVELPASGVLDPRRRDFKRALALQAPLVDQCAGHVQLQQPVALQALAIAMHVIARQRQAQLAAAEQAADAAEGLQACAECFIGADFAATIGQAAQRQLALATEQPAVAVVQRGKIQAQQVACAELATNVEYLCAGALQVQGIGGVDHAACVVQRCGLQAQVGSGHQLGLAAFGAVVHAACGQRQRTTGAAQGAATVVQRSGRFQRQLPGAVGHDAAATIAH
ncbi:hypothetical protein JLDANKMP_03364 [Stenotrophomonas sp. PE591]|nr:hypothetical protein [Stenotrophomonas sp. PE591]